MREGQALRPHGNLSKKIRCQCLILWRIKMKEYLPKNPNEFNLDGKRYIEKIKRCECKSVERGYYCLYCNIHQRGDHVYTYKKGDSHISRGGKKLYLSEEALEQVKTTAAAFEEDVTKTREWQSVKVPCKGSFITISYHISEDGEIWYYVECLKSGEEVKKFYRSFDDLHHLLCDNSSLFYDSFADRDYYDEYTKDDILKYPTKETISKNPVYNAAVEQGDEFFARFLKLRFGIADRKVCSSLSEAIGYRILPALSEKYDKNYYIEGPVDVKLLENSGYKLLHTPVFGMMGKTRNIHTLNPHKKYGTDAAPVNAEAIKIDTFLKLFDDEKNFEKEDGPMLSQNINKKDKVYSVCKNSGEIAPGEVFRGVAFADEHEEKNIPTETGIVCCGKVSENEMLFRTGDGRVYFPVYDGWGKEDGVLYGLKRGFAVDFGHPTDINGLVSECEAYAGAYASYAGALFYKAKKDALRKILSVMKKS